MTAEGAPFAKIMPPGASSTEDIDLIIDEPDLPEVHRQSRDSRLSDLVMQDHNTTVLRVSAANPMEDDVPRRKMTVEREIFVNRAE